MSQHPYQNPDGSWVIPAPDCPHPPQHNPFVSTLSVSDVERLAKSGVKVEFRDVAPQIVQDPPPPPKHTPLIDAFWDRWKRSHPEHAYDMGMTLPYQIAAIVYGETVYVFVGPRDREPFILEDMKLLYPSDALMAKLALLEKVS